MSQAIPDLRSSTIGSTSFHSAASGQDSIYTSAVAGEAGASNFFQAPTPKRKAEAKVREHLILKVDGEQTIAQLVVSRHLQAMEEADLNDGKPPAPTLDRLSLSFEVGNMVSFITPASTCALMRFSDDCIMAASQQQESIIPKKGKQSTATSYSLETSITVKEVDIVCAYESPSDLGAVEYESFTQTLQSYWIRPAKVHPEIGHLRLRLQRIDCKLKTLALETSILLQMGDAALYEHLSPSLTSGTAAIAVTLPLIFFDRNLCERYTPHKSQASEMPQI